MKIATTYLLVCHRVANQCQIQQTLESCQRLEICQLREPIIGKDEGRDIRDRGRKIRLDRRDAVLRGEDGMQARLEREVAELHDRIVGQVNRIVVLGSNLVSCLCWRAWEGNDLGTYLGCS